MLPALLLLSTAAGSARADGRGGIGGAAALAPTAWLGTGGRLGGGAGGGAATVGVGGAAAEGEGGPAAPAPIAFRCLVAAASSAKADAAVDDNPATIREPKVRIESDDLVGVRRIAPEDDDGNAAAKAAPTQDAASLPNRPTSAYMKRQLETLARELLAETVTVGALADAELVEVLDLDDMEMTAALRRV